MNTFTTFDQLQRNKKENLGNDRLPIFPLYLTAVFAYALFFTFQQKSPVPIHVHLTAILITATSFIPISIWYTGQRDELPIFEIIILSYALQFSMPIYTQANFIIIFSNPIPIAWEDIYQSLWYVEAGVASIISAYYFARALFRKFGSSQIDLPINPERRTQYLSIAIVGGVLFLLLSTLGFLRNASLGALVGLLSRQANVAIILLAYDIYRKKEKRPRMIALFYGATGLLALVGLTTGLLQNALIPLVLIFVVRWHVHGRLPWAWAISGILLFLILNPAKFEYRNQAWYGQGQLTFIQRVNLWQDLIVDNLRTTLAPDNDTIRSENTEGALARFDLIHRFAYVQRLTPSQIPYYRGKTYEYFLYAWVPRLIWPDKPSASIANDIIDTDYRLSFAGSSTTIGIGQLPEAYANFGLRGIIGVLALQGIIFAYLDRMFNGRNSDGGRAIYLSVMIYFLNGIGTSSAILFGALFQQLLVNTLLLRPFSLGYTTIKAEEDTQQSSDLLSDSHSK